MELVQRVMAEAEYRGGNRQNKDWYLYALRMLLLWARIHTGLTHLNLTYLIPKLRSSNIILSREKVGRVNSGEEMLVKVSSGSSLSTLTVKLYKYVLFQALIISCM